VLRTERLKPLEVGGSSAADEGALDNYLFPIPKEHQANPFELACLELTVSAEGSALPALAISVPTVAFHMDVGPSLFCRRAARARRPTRRSVPSRNRLMLGRKAQTIATVAATA